MTIKMFDLVVPKNHDPELNIGRVIGVSRLESSIGPLLKIRDITTKKLIKRFPMHLDKLEKAKV